MYARANDALFAPLVGVTHVINNRLNAGSNEGEKGTGLKFSSFPAELFSLK